MLKYTFLAALALVVSCGPSQSGLAFPDTTIDDSFAQNTLRRSDGNVVPYTVGIFEDAGVYVVCAAVQNVRSSQEKKVLAALKVTVNGRTMQRGLSWARVYRSGVQFIGQPSTCRKTNTPVVENPVFNVELTQTSFTKPRD